MYVYWIHLPEHIDIITQGYIGIAMNFEQRMFAHKSCAKTGKNQSLYNAIRKYGWDNLIKEIIVIADKQYCLDVEKKLRPSERIGWNISIGGNDIVGIKLKGSKQSALHIHNRAKSLKGRISGFAGKKHTDSAKQKCKLINLGKTISIESKQKNSDAHKKPLLVNGIKYNSWQDASNITGIPMGSINYLLKKQPKNSKWSKYKLELVL